MFTKFEHISNRIGKRVLLLLFYFFVAIQCKACAVYVFKIQENFKCPLCEFLKENSPKYFFNHSISFKQVLPIVVCDEIKVAHSQHSQVCKENVVEIAKEYKQAYIKKPPIFKEPENAKLTAFTETSFNLPFYILCHQLKIGEHTLFHSSIKKNYS